MSLSCYSPALTPFQSNKRPTNRDRRKEQALLDIRCLLEQHVGPRLLAAGFGILVPPQFEAAQALANVITWSAKDAIDLRDYKLLLVCWYALGHAPVDTEYRVCGRIPFPEFLTVVDLHPDPKYSCRAQAVFEMEPRCKGAQLTQVVSRYVTTCAYVQAFVRFEEARALRPTARQQVFQFACSFLSVLYQHWPTFFDSSVREDNALYRRLLQTSNKASSKLTGNLLGPVRTGRATSATGMAVMWYAAHCLCFDENTRTTLLLAPKTKERTSCSSLSSTLACSKKRRATTSLERNGWTRIANDLSESLGGHSPNSPKRLRSAKAASFCPTTPTDASSGNKGEENGEEEEEHDEANEEESSEWSFGTAGDNSCSSVSSPGSSVSLGFEKCVVSVPSLGRCYEEGETRKVTPKSPGSPGSLSSTSSSSTSSMIQLSKPIAGKIRRSSRRRKRGDMKLTNNPMFHNNVQDDSPKSTRRKIERCQAIIKFLENQGFSGTWSTPDSDAS
jgi:hypothetical protein